MAPPTIAGAAILALLAGCASELTQRPAAQDPTSASAPEAPYRPLPGYAPDPLLQPPSTAPEPKAPEQPAQPEPQPGAAPTPTAPKPKSYVCPMHPSVRSSAPGRCPKCNMKLVPEKGHTH